MRSFSSYEPGQKGFQGNVIQRQFEGQAARKYTSIEVGRDRGEGGVGQRGNLRQMNNWTSVDGHCHQPQSYDSNRVHHNVGISSNHTQPQSNRSTPLRLQ